MTWPAVGSLIPKLAAMSGSRPIATNSVVPIPKPPSASANTASQRTVGSVAMTDCGRVGRSTLGVTRPAYGDLRRIHKLVLHFLVESGETYVFVVESRS